jgi:hypothetical protein
MTNGAISVRRLRVAAGAPLGSRIGFAARMEDALRTSSLPAEWKGRLVLIRRLRLRAGEGWPSHLLARRIEATWRAGAAQAVLAVRASADVEAVWFADEVSARLVLMERLARGRDVSAWFWQRWLSPGTDVARQIAKLLAAPDGATLAAEERVRFFEDACSAIAEPELIDRVIACCELEQLRWLLPEVTWRVAPQLGRGNSHSADSGAERRNEPAVRSPDEPEFREIARRFAHAALGLRSSPEEPSAIERRNEASPAPEGEGAYTEWAGLFFALNLFRSTGTFRATVGGLRDIAAFVRVPADDPLLGVLDRLDARGEGQQSESDEIRAPALRNLRVACLRATRRPLRRVLHRAGRVHLNRTHLTIALRLAEVSLPVRIAGLDVDPGWVAWMGRVVRFDYD